MMSIHSGLLQLRCCCSVACPELDEGLSMSGNVPFTLSVAERSRRVAYMDSAHQESVLPLGAEGSSLG